MRFELTLLGTNSALPAFGRFPSSQALNVQENHYLIDCGEGAQIRMSEFGVRRSRIRQVFISHLHGDHVYGLTGFLSSLALLGREEPMDIYSPPGLEEAIRVFLKHTGGLSFPLRFTEIDTGRHQLIFEDGIIEAYSLPLVHRVPTSGFLFREKERPRNMRPEKIEAYHIPYRDIPAIKSGADYVLPNGRRVPNEELTLPPPAPRSYAYCSDTAFHEPLASMARGVNLLYHESTFCEDLREQAPLTGHSTARQAAEIARLAGAGKLILGHYSSRYKSLETFLREAREVFPNTELGLDGKVFEVPLEREI